MAYGEGANWEGNRHNIGTDAVTFEVHVASEPTVGVVRLKIVAGEGPAEIAKNLATEWNERQPIKDVIAVAPTNSSLTAFLFTGPLADGTHEFTSMAATFDGQARQEMTQIGQSVASSQNTDLSVTRTGIEIKSAAGVVVCQQTTSVIGGAQIQDPVHT